MGQRRSTLGLELVRFFSMGSSGLAMPVEDVQYDWMLEELFVEVGCIAKLGIKGESGEPFED